MSRIDLKTAPLAFTEHNADGQNATRRYRAAAKAMTLLGIAENGRQAKVVVEEFPMPDSVLTTHLGVRIGDWGNSTLIPFYRINQEIMGRQSRLKRAMTSDELAATALEVAQLEKEGKLAENLRAEIASSRRAVGFVPWDKR